MDADLPRVIQDALDRRAADTYLPRAPRRTPDSNNPYQAEPARRMRERDPAKWARPAYADRDAERIANRLSPKEKP